IGRALRYRRDLSLIMFDIDRFKGVNDSFGHLAGDHVLKHLASVIKTRIRREDVLARYGGEEFAIVLPEIDHFNAMQFAEKIRKLVEQAEFKFEDAVIPVTVSIGVASLRGEIEDALELIREEIAIDPAAPPNALSYIDDASLLVTKALGLVATILDVDELEDGMLHAERAPAKLVEIVDRARGGNRAHFEVRQLTLQI